MPFSPSVFGLQRRHICAGTNWPLSAPGLAHICAGTDWPLSAPGLAHICAGTDWPTCTAWCDAFVTHSVAADSDEFYKAELATCTARDRTSLCRLGPLTVLRLALTPRARRRTHTSVRTRRRRAGLRTLTRAGGMCMPDLPLLAVCRHGAPSACSTATWCAARGSACSGASVRGSRKRRADSRRRPVHACMHACMRVFDRCCPVAARL